MLRRKNEVPIAGRRSRRARSSGMVTAALKARARRVCARRLYEEAHRYTPTPIVLGSPTRTRRSLSTTSLTHPTPSRADRQSFPRVPATPSEV